MKLMKLAVAIASFALTIPGLTAQSATTTAPTINQRRENQQDRIGKGVENGSLTAGETARIEHQQTRLNKEVRNMKADGSFTARERTRVQRQQNGLSREIYNQKHDAQRQETPTNAIDARQRMQQQRIGRGIQNGSLTAREASNLERKEAGVERRENRMQASGGKFTRGERNAVNRQLNNTSRQIYSKKHNGRAR